MDEEFDLDVLPEETSVEEEEVLPAKPKFKVKVDGSEIEVDEDELLNGYSRQADYTKGKQALAEERKAIEEQRKVVLEAKQASEEIVELEYLGKQAEGKLKEYANVDWVKFMTEDPTNAQLHRVKYEELSRQYQQHVQYTSQRKQVLDALREQEVNTSLTKFNDDLKAEFPNWEKESGNIATTAQEAYGFSVEELNQLADVRSIKVLRDAANWQRYLKAKAVKHGEVKTSVFDKQLGSKVSAKPTAETEWANRMKKYQ